MFDNGSRRALCEGKFSTYYFKTLKWSAYSPLSGHSVRFEDS